LKETLWQQGQQVKNFRIERVIGSGGMADLFLAKDLVLKRQVVIKVLNPRFSGEERYSEHFLREARIQANLENPHIVQVLSLFNYEGRPCIVMQHIEGTDLDRVIKKAKQFKKEKGEKGALSIERAVHIFLQILEGIGFVHKYRIIHGDIKPANILLNEQGRVKVADFGLSFLLRSERSGEAGVPAAGTPYYISPEQIMDDRVDMRTDIYSLGITLFNMLTGKLPFGNIKNTSELIELHLEGVRDRAGDVLETFPDASLRSAILKAVERDPDKRYQSCLEFSLALKEERPYEMYSELLRLSLMTKEDITSAERGYLEKISRKRGLGPESAKELEENIRKEIGLSSTFSKPNPEDDLLNNHDGMEGKEEEWTVEDMKDTKLMENKYIDTDSIEQG
jgi:serine/threonine-protein kinase